MILARKRKAGAGSTVSVVALGLLGLFALIPKEVWFGVLGLGAIWVAYRLFGSGKNELPIDTELRGTDEPWAMAKVNTLTRSSPARSENRSRAAERQADSDEPVSVTQVSAIKVTPAFWVPSAPRGLGPGVWIPKGQAVEVAGVTIPGGMIYVGSSMKAPSGNNDPCLIDPSKQVSELGDYTERQMGYWPSYSDVPSTARRAYLNWLAAGRSDPEVDIGYVFLFFYGLERRAILDAAEDQVAQSDGPIVAEEIRRLLSIYGEKSGSFKSYAEELLNWVSLMTHPSKLYERPLPVLVKTYELPLHLRLALGQAAVDGVPVPNYLALAWVKLDPNSYLRTPAIRCEEKFDALFVLYYTKIYGAGMVIPRNRTKLKFVYRPASAGFRGFNEIKLTFGETPDVTVLMAPIKKLREIVDTTTNELDAYSRFIGRNPDARDDLEGLLHLPATLWPDSVQKEIRGLKERLVDGFVLMSFQELLASLGAKTTFTKEKSQAFTRALESINIGLEPDILGGSKVPRPEDLVVLFASPILEATSRAIPSYQAALLTLQLASSVAMADGEFSDHEVNHLRSQVRSWVHLTPIHRHRLLAYLRLLMAAPAPLTALKKKLEALDSSAKESIAVFMATLVQADGTVSPAEVKVLENVYKALGLDSKKVFNDIHAVAVSTSSAAVARADAKVGQTGLKLDPARIAALQKDTAKVSALLAAIFTEERAMAPTTMEPEAEPEHIEIPAGLLGLDESLSTFARMLLSRPQWSRDELLDVAADLDLMLDGALERINEASFDKHDIPFTEGDDPIDINAEVREEIAA